MSLFKKEEDEEFMYGNHSVIIENKLKSYIFQDKNNVL